MKIAVATNALRKQVKHSQSRSFIGYALGTMLNLLASYAMLVVLLRGLSKQDYGLYGLYVSAFSMLLILFNLGHKELVFKYASKSQQSRQLPALAATFKSFFFLNCILLLLIQCLLLLNVTYYLAAMAFLLSGWLLTGSAYWRGKAQYHRDAFAAPAQRCLWFVGCLVLLWNNQGLSLEHVFVASGLATAVCIVWLFRPIIVRFKTTFLEHRIDHKQVKLLLNYLVIEMASVLYLKSDVLLLHWFELELTVIADYFFALQIFDILVLIIAPIGYFYFNRLAGGQTHSYNSSMQLTTMAKYMGVMIGLIGLIHLIVIFLAPVVFELVIPKYVASIPVVSMIIFSLYLVAVNIILSSKLIIDNKELSYAKICFAALVVNLGLNIILIPRFQLSGVLISKFCTELVIMVLLLLATRNGGKTE